MFRRVSAYFVVCRRISPCFAVFRRLLGVYTDPCAAAPAAPLLVTAFLLYVRPLLCYSALVPAVSPSARLDSTLECVTVFYPAKSYIIVCSVSLLYRVLSPLALSVNYCILHIAWLMLNSGDL